MQSRWTHAKIDRDVITTCSTGVGNCRDRRVCSVRRALRKAQRRCPTRRTARALTTTVFHRPDAAARRRSDQRRHGNDPNSRRRRDNRRRPRRPERYRPSDAARLSMGRNSDVILLPRRRPHRALAPSTIFSVPDGRDLRKHAVSKIWFPFPRGKGSGVRFLRRRLLIATNALCPRRWDR
jgi:hypothetical protein